MLLGKAQRALRPRSEGSPPGGGRRQRARGAARPCDGDTTCGFLTRAMPWIGAGCSRSAPGQDRTSLFGADLWRAGETKKARSVVALSRVPRGERGTPVSPPAAGQVVSELLTIANVTFLRSRSGRLSGLLSGCPPTDTRPQARAKLGEGAISLYCDPLQDLSAAKMKKVLRGW